VTTSATRDFLSDIVRGNRVPRATLGYFEARLSGLIHQALLQLFGRLERNGFPIGGTKAFTRRDLAHRIGRRPEQITRWLSYPGNLTIATASDLFVGMGYQLESVVLADLTTGEKVSFPQKAYAQMDAAHVGEMLPTAEACSDSFHHKDSIRDIQSAALSQGAWALVSDRLSDRPGKAAADQQNLRGGLYAKKVHAIRDLAA
jgi:hypothetical protein